MILVAVFLFGLVVISAQTGNETSTLFGGAPETQSKASVVNFWTDEKFASAVDVTPELSPSLVGAPKAAEVFTTGSPIFVPPMEQTNNNQTAKSSKYSAYQWTTGRVFWSCDGRNTYSCSGSIVASGSRRLIATAGHCVFDTSTLRWYSNCNWVFVPGYSNGNRPYGTWTPYWFYSFTAYTKSSPDYNYDIAFVVMNTNYGYRIGDYLGYQGIGFNYPYYQPTYSLGYPVNIANGETLQSCYGVPMIPGFYLNGIQYRGQGLQYCGMGGGCSGGPWLQNFISGTGIGYTVSVNSFKMANYSNTIFGPRFDSNVYSVWSQIHNI